MDQQNVRIYNCHMIYTNTYQHVFDLIYFDLIVDNRIILRHI